MPVAVGFTLQPDEEFLERCRPLLDLVDYAEVAPETLWRVQRPEGGAARVVDNGYVGAIHGLIQRHSLFCVAHGVGLSLAALDDDGEGDDDGKGGRVALWAAQLQRNHERFAFQWMSDHSGLTTTAGLHLALPVPVPPTRRRVAATAAKLQLLRSVCRGPSLVETSALPFVVGEPLDDAAFIAACVDDDGAGVLLDLHNLWTMAQNLSFDVDDWLRCLPFDKVVSIHVSGGGHSDVGWLPGGRTVRLDSHDDDVPDAVFDLLARVAPRCPQLLGVTLERMEGSLSTSSHGEDGDAAVARLARELEKIRAIVALPAEPATPEQRRGQKRLLHAEDEDVDDGAWARALLAADPVAAVHQLVDHVDNDDGVRTAALLIAKLRFERLLNGDAPDHDGRTVLGEFSADPGAFAAKFRRYHRAVEPTAWNPLDEGRLWRAFSG